MPKQLPHSRDWDRNGHAIETMLTLLANLADSLSNSMGSAICNIELAAKGGRHTVRHIRKAKKLSERGMAELKMLMLITNGLRDYLHWVLEAERDAPLPERYFRNTRGRCPAQ
jgi:hypothetical protein